MRKKCAKSPKTMVYISFFRFRIAAFPKNLRTRFVKKIFRKTLRFAVKLQVAMKTASLVYCRPKNTVSAATLRF